METKLDLDSWRTLRLRADRFGGLSVQRSRSRVEGEDGVSDMSDVLSGLDPKPGELPMARLKFG